MAAINYSRQREAIKTYLISTKTHPTADEVYEHVRHDFPKISLATVYRNLNLLVEIGEAIKVTNTKGKEHFDADVTPHDHVACTTCGAVADIQLPTEHSRKIHEMIQDHYDGMLDDARRLYYGTCRSCMKK